MTTRTVSIGCAALLLAACQPQDAAGDAGGAPAETAAAIIPDPDSTEPFAGIGADEVVRFTGTEPFWGGQVAGTTLTYTTPDNPDGTAMAVARFAGRGGLAFSGTLDGAAFELALTVLACSDGMSDRTYPFTVTLRIGDDLRNGCGWSERHPFEGPDKP